MSEPIGFETFYRDEFEPVVIFLRRQGASLDEAWDAAQLAFLDAYRGWGKIRAPAAWVRKTSSRNFAKQRQRTSEEIRRLVTAANRMPRPSFASIDTGVEEKAVYEALAGLPLRQRQVMAWHYDGYANEEIAQLLSIKTEAVRANLYQARQTLRRSLATMIARGRDGEGGIP